jgi:glycosyltransferase involved in cell wall biosynthesis
VRLFYLTYGNLPSRWAHGIQLMKMAEALARHVGDVRVVTRAHLSRRFAPPFDYESWYGLRRPLRVEHLWDWRGPRGPVFDHVRCRGFEARAVRHARRSRADLVYTRSPLAARLAVAAGLPTLLETHLTGDEERFEWAREAAQDPRLRGVVTITPELGERYQELGLPAQKLLVWPDAVDLRAFESPQPRAVLRRRLGLPLDAFLATHCGSLGAERGIETLVQSVAARKDVTLLLVGGSPADLARVRELARGLPNVRLAGHVEHRLVPAYLAASDVLVASYSSRTPGAFHGSPLKLFEYMASGRPIVAADFPALRRHLVHERNALVVRRDDPRALEAGIARLREDRGLGQQLAERAAEDVRPYTWDARARAVLERFAPEALRS